MSADMTYAKVCHHSSLPKNAVPATNRCLKGGNHTTQDCYVGLWYAPNGEAAFGRVYAGYSEGIRAWFPYGGENASKNLGEFWVMTNDNKLDIEWVRMKNAYHSDYQLITKEDNRGNRWCPAICEWEDREILGKANLNDAKAYTCFNDYEFKHDGSEFTDAIVPVIRLDKVPCRVIDIKLDFSRASTERKGMEKIIGSGEYPNNSSQEMNGPEVTFTKTITDEHSVSFSKEDHWMTSSTVGMNFSMEFPLIKVNVGGSVSVTAGGGGKKTMSTTDRTIETRTVSIKHCPRVAPHSTLRKSYVIDVYKMDIPFEMTVETKSGKRKTVHGTYHGTQGIQERVTQSDDGGDGGRKLVAGDVGIGGFLSWLGALSEYKKSNSFAIMGNNGRYVCGENGTQPVNCNRPKPLAWEIFTAESVGNGRVALKCMGKYLSSENGERAMNCNRPTRLAWEIFQWIDNDDGTFSLIGNNGKYVSSENGEKAMNCNRPTKLAWEKFKRVAC